jgi:penicillin-binding protein 2
MIFKRKKQHFNFEEALQDSNFLGSDGKSVFQSRIIQRMNAKGIYILSGLMVVVFCVFVFFSFKLQVTEHVKYLQKSNNNQFVSVPILPTRGSILDRNGEVLAKSQKTEDSVDGFERVYTERQGFGHVLGYVNYPQKDSSGIYWQNNFEGVSGLEAYYDQLLSGRVGKKLYERSAKNISDEETTFIVDLPIEGKDIQTSIDADLQEYTYKALKKFVDEKQFKGGVAIIMDIETGQILTLTNYPEYDPKKMIPNPDRNEYIKNINVDKSTPLLNRAIAGTFAPGSTMKPVFALAALQLGLIDPVTSIFSSGRIEVPNSVDPTKKSISRDWKAHGWVNVRTALANSSDVFFYAVGGGYEGQKGLGIDRIDEWSEAFGVNSLTGIDLGGETIGNIPNPEWKQKIFKEAWRLGDTYNSSIGQFGFLLTPIGLLRLTTAIATNGELITPKIRLDPNGKTSKQVKVSANEEWYKVVNEGMRMVVTVGTAKNLNSKYFEIAGKSGTAEVGVKKDKIQSWIAGYFPYKEPKYAFVFLCELGVREVSPTPNVLARDVLEYMYINKPELFNASTTVESIEDLGGTPITEEDLLSR